MESVKIVFACVVAAVLCGIVHDQITVRICLEYFTVFHPQLFPTQSPTLLALGWGVIATWWAGAIIGILIAIAARAGSRRALTLNEVRPYIVRLMLFMAASAVVFGAIGYFWSPLPEVFADSLPNSMHRRFLADWWSHNASYASGFAGGLTTCFVIWRQRAKVAIFASHS